MSSSSQSRIHKDSHDIENGAMICLFLSIKVIHKGRHLSSQSKGGCEWKWWRFRHPSMDVGVRMNV